MENPPNRTHLMCKKPFASNFLRSRRQISTSAPNRPEQARTGSHDSERRIVILFWLCGRTKPFFDQTWKPDDIKKVM